MFALRARFVPELCLALVLCVPGRAAFSYAFAGGSGEPDDPYQIATAEQLISIGADPNLLDKHYILVEDIDLDPNLLGRKVFTDSVIGAATVPSYFRNTAFSGTFDGNRHVIRNLVIDAPDSNGVGLFGAVGPLGQVINVSLEGVRICGNLRVGGLIGDNWGEIAECYCAGTIEGQQSIGGLLGLNSGYMRSSYSGSKVSGGYEVGGLVGNNRSETMSSARGRIVSCYANGSISGERCIGGLVGSNGGNISSSYSVSHVQGSADVGGFVGQYSGLIYLCYWNTVRSGLSTSPAGIGKDTQQMMSVETFRGWGYDAVWTIQERTDYPRLHWEGAGGDLLVDAPRTYAGGTGEPHNPYQIATPEQFAAIAWYRADFDKHFLLVNDIDMQSVDPDEVMPIGTMQVPFTGVFDGDGHAILNYRYAAPFDDCVGLFRCVGLPCGECAGVFWCGADTPCPDSEPTAESMRGVVKNVDLNDVDISGSMFVGALIGVSHGMISDCHSDGTVSGNLISGGLVGHSYGVISGCNSTAAVTGSYHTGGLVGHSRGQITLSWAKGELAGDAYVGGLVGTAAGPINGCFAAGDVAGNESVGGFVGFNTNTIQSCYSTANAAGDRHIGGLVGTNSGAIIHCYSAGLVDGHNAAGGLVGSDGFDGEGVSDSCYWDVDTSRLTESAGGSGKTTSEMKQKETFENWDFESVWDIAKDQTYPFFRQCAAGDINGDCEVDFSDLAVLAAQWLQGSLR